MEEILTAQPGQGLRTRRMPGHWVLARLGKRVLRPGGLELTERLLADLGIDTSDDVVEFAPGLGVTARLTLARLPASYTAVERDEAAAAKVRQNLTRDTDWCITARAEATGLPPKSYSVVYGEAMLTMQSEPVKQQIIREAARLLRDGGRYGIHEMCLASGVDDAARRDIHRSLTGVVNHGVRPLTIAEWTERLDAAGFQVGSIRTAPMALLEPRRLVRDEGLLGAMRFIFRALADSEARRRVLKMRRAFRENRSRIQAVAITAVKRTTD